MRLVEKGQRETRVGHTGHGRVCADRKWKAHGWGERGPAAGRMEER